MTGHRDDAEKLFATGILQAMVAGGTAFAYIRVSQAPESAFPSKTRIRPTRLIESIQFRVFRNPPDVYEFRMDRRRLVEGKTGGLRAVRRLEVEASPLFRAFPLGPNRERIPREPVLKLCAGCHGNAVLSISEFVRQRPHDPVREFAMDVELGSTVGWKSRQYSWGLLQGWLENHLPPRRR